MAFVDWIKVEHTTPGKAEVLRIASFLKISPYEVLGRLIELWIWADQNTVDGKTFVPDMSSIDHVVRMANFGKAMRKSGWLTVDGDGFVFPNFLRHNGKSAKKRAEDSRKKKKQRTNVPLEEGQKEDADTSSSSSSSSLEEEGGVGETRPIGAAGLAFQFHFLWSLPENHGKKPYSPVQLEKTFSEYLRLRPGSFTAVMAEIEREGRDRNEWPDKLLKRLGETNGKYSQPELQDGSVIMAKAKADFEEAKRKEAEAKHGKS